MTVPDTAPTTGAPGPDGTASAGPGAGAAATGHPRATEAAVAILRAGGTAVDAAVAAQAVICVIMPQAAGLGGDVLALVHHRRHVSAVNGTGRSPRGLLDRPPTTGGASVTVPGLVDGWATLHRRWGRLPMATLLEPAARLAEEGVTVDDQLAEAVGAQLPRLRAGGAEDWSLLRACASAGEGAAAAEGATWRQPELARLLVDIGRRGPEAFYAGPAGDAVVAAARRHGGRLAVADLQGHRTPCPDPVDVPWQDGVAYVQPPMSQGILLAVALQRVRELVQEGVALTDHVLVEVTEAAFGLRAACGRGTELLQEHLDVDPERASGRGGPRAYLHTAGVATVDADGQVVSSLVSVFDDFGSGVYVPELGIVLNNRAAGFTEGDNEAAPDRRPVHTLAPALLTTPGGVLGIATPGADGQVQTLLQVLTAAAAPGGRLETAVAAPRWRSQEGHLLVEAGHPAHDDLAARGHRVVEGEPGADAFGAVVAAGTRDGSTFAVADWRRQTSSGGAA